MIQTDIENLEKLSGIALPDPVKLFLAGNPKKDPWVRHSARWRLFSLRELTQIVELRAIQRIPLLPGANDGLHFRGKRKTSEIEDTGGKKHPIDHLARTLTFAEGAGDLVYLNADDEFSVWIFYSDAGFIEKTADSLWEWVGSCEYQEIENPRRQPSAKA